MENSLNDIQFYQLLFYAAFGVILLIAFWIINTYIIPLVKERQHIINRYWQKIQIISWVLFSSMFFIALFRANLYITLIFTVIILGLGWNFWRNIFSGILIKFNNQFEIGEVISTDFVKGELIAIHLAQSELSNEKGEVVIIPNRKLRGAVLTHYYKKSNVQTHSFKLDFPNTETIDSIYQMAINCPYISANQKIEVERTTGNEFLIKASILDLSFVDKVNGYFSKEIKE